MIEFFFIASQTPVFNEVSSTRIYVKIALISLDSFGEMYFLEGTTSRCKKIIF